LKKTDTKKEEMEKELEDLRRRQSKMFYYEAIGNFSGEVTGYRISDGNGVKVETVMRNTGETDASLLERVKARMRNLQLSGSGMDMRQMAGGSILAQLKKLKVAKTKYLGAIRSAGTSNGYDPKKIQLSDDGEHKIMVVDEEGKKHYAGRVGYGDFHIWTMLESKKDVPSGFASQKQKDYLARATKIKGNWKKDKYSPNSLAIALLW
jgi:hypothetical protein